MKATACAVLIAAFSLTTACNSNAGYGGGGNAETTAEITITRDMIRNAQEVWIGELVRIGAAHAEGGDAEAVAREVLNTHYDFANNPVLFKPTLTHGEQTFRPSKEGALAYFVGGNDSFPNDSGFALRPYVSGTTEIAEVFIHRDVALAQGNITLEAYDGSTVTVDKTFGYRLDNDGSLRIVLHHSSLPFQP